VAGEKSRGLRAGREKKKNTVVISESEEKSLESEKYPQCPE
jgi:hypothetical protein